MSGPRLHHVGFVVASIHREVADFQESMTATWDGVVFHDPAQKVRVTFLSTNQTDAQIELVEPASEDSPVTRFVQQGGGLHHLCYEVDNLEAALVHARANKAVVVRRPQPAVAFQGRHIAWVLTSGKLLIEYLERS